MCPATVVWGEGGDVTVIENFEYIFEFVYIFGSGRNILIWIKEATFRFCKHQDEV